MVAAVAAVSLEDCVAAVAAAQVIGSDATAEAEVEVLEADLLGWNWKQKK